MFKKIILGALLVGIIGVLIAGAVIRTNAVAGNGTAGESGRRGRTAESGAAVVEGDGRLAGRGGFGQGAGRSATEVAPEPLADVTSAEWLSVTGSVVSVTADLVEIETAAGEVIPLEGRPLSYAQEQGFSLTVGDSVELSGFDEDGEFKIGRVTSLTSGTSITLRDTSGRPGWSGRGRRG